MNYANLAVLPSKVQVLYLEFFIERYKEAFNEELNAFNNSA